MAGSTEKLTAEGEKLLRELRELENLEVFVGFQHGDDEKDGADLCDIAAWNELGTEHSPSRPFFRRTVERHEDDINTVIAQSKQKLMNGDTAENILSYIGSQCVGFVQETIVNGDFVPNSQETISRKKSDKPLIDTGHMRQSVHFIIRKKQRSSKPCR